jgi:hypothetical protein
MPTERSTRSLSAALFNSEKMIEVVLALNVEAGQATAQQVARRLGVNHDLARKPMLRLVDLGLLTRMPRTGGSRSELFYAVVEGAAWDALVTLCDTLVGGVAPQEPESPSAPQHLPTSA